MPTTTTPKPTTTTPKPTTTMPKPTTTTTKPTTATATLPPNSAEISDTLPPNAVVITDKACDTRKSGYLQSSPGQLDNLAACIQSCQGSATCNSITFYGSKFCAHFSTACADVVPRYGAYVVRFQPATAATRKPTTTTTKPTTATPTLPPNAIVITDKACDVQKSGYLQSSPGKLDNLAACIQSCQGSATCNSITFYRSKFCSHFSTACTNLKIEVGATSMRTTP